MLLGLGCTASPPTTCSAGTPGCTVCDDHHLDCNGQPEDGCEADLNHDSLNCGRCGKACPGITQQQALCIDGECGLCPFGTRDCNGRGTDGCEKNILSDPQSCGACGRTCPAIANGYAGCLMGSCGLDHCKEGFQDCNADPQDGCETDVRTDLKNCGNCGAQCPVLAGGAVLCVDGACTAGMCKMGFDSCDKQNPLQYCQTNLMADEDNCGRCGTKCPNVANIQRACVGGSCSSIACQPNWQNCDMNAATGCETNVNKDVNHCGACGRACKQDHATSGCVEGACRIFSCDNGFGNCNANAADGCEADLAKDSNNCGVCGAACINTQNATLVTCDTGKCTILSCAGNPPTGSAPQWADCDGLYNNGCEIDLRSSLANCGVCNSRCVDKPHAKASCKLSICQQTCDPGWSDCDNNAKNGCEVNTASDREHCGSCTTRCDFLEECGNGTCVPVAM